MVFEWAAESINVRACERAEIIVPGARLWRSTVVTLGSQKADEIFVLPDMNGIIVTFKPVHFPSTWSNLENDFRAPLTVWTSQGSTTVPIPVTFKALGKDAKPGCPVTPADAMPNRAAAVQ